MSRFYFYDFGDKVCIAHVVLAKQKKETIASFFWGGVLCLLTQDQLSNLSFTTIFTEIIIIRETMEVIR